MVEALRPYMHVRGALLQGWTEDGRGLYVLTRFGDTMQLHRVDAPGGARRQLTFLDEPVSEAHRRPGSRELVLAVDRGGSEFYQLYRFDAGRPAMRLLTDGASRNLLTRWDADGRRFAFTSTRRNGRSNDVWLAELEAESRAAAQPDRAPRAGELRQEPPLAARMVVAAPDGAAWSGVDFHPDGSLLLVAQYVSVADSRIHLLDLATGELRLLVGAPSRPGSHADLAPRFTPDGAGVLLVTDALGEFRQLARLDLETGDLVSLTPQLSWDVEALETAERASIVAFVVNEGGVSSLWLLDPASGQHRRVEDVPEGIIEELAFTPDGSRLALTLNGPATPSDVFSLVISTSELTARGLTRWTFSEAGGLDPAGFVSPERVSIASFDGVPVPAFVYRPRRPGPHAVVVHLHGGPEAQERPLFNPAYQFWLAELGVAVVAPNVRGSSGYGKTYVKMDDRELREDAVKDVGAVLDWIDTQPDLDGRRVAVAGGSYGGYLALASLVHQGTRLRAGVDVVGISNFVTFLESTQEYRRDLRRAEYGDERDPLMRAFLERISPNRNADRIRSPLLVAQGVNDPRVPVSEAEQIVAAVRANGVPVWYVKALNEGHGFQRRENRALFNAVAASFLETHLQLA